MKFAQGCSMVVVMLAAAFLLTGCGDQARKKSGDKVAKNAKTAAKEEAKETHGGHEGWWCQEHGVPEHLCSLCDPAVAAKLKKDGDWCKLHDRAESQCFKCDPSRYAKFEAMYVAKYNKKPELPPAEEFQK